MPTVLLAEDDPDLRQALTALLESEGWQVLVASDGYEALCLIDAHPVSLLILDFWMPHFNGAQIIAYLEAIGIDVPSVMLSAHPSVDLVAGRSRVDAWFRKPLDHDAFLRAARRLMGSAPAASLETGISGTYSATARPAESAAVAGATSSTKRSQG